MDKIDEILLELNNNKQVTQRQIANKIGLSVGTTNALLRHLETKNLIIISKRGRSFTYQLTQLGRQRLNVTLMAYRKIRLKTEQQANHRLNTAIILAAGKAKDFELPACLLPIDNTTPIDRTLTLLNSFKIENVYVIVGYGANQVKAHLANRNVIFLENMAYATTGTMRSLALVRGQINGDCLIIEGDLLYESMLLDQIMDNKAANSIITASISGSGDEAFVDFDQQNNLVRISKDIRQMNRLSAEMVGISRVSHTLLNEMFYLYQDNQNEWLNYEYLLLEASQSYEVKCLLSSNTAWANLDNEKQYRRAQDYIYPLIRRNENDNQIDYAKQQIQTILNVQASAISDIHFAGGMTNTNYEAIVDGQDYFIRIPGKWTEVMIDRQSEALNAQLGSILGLNVETKYINPQTGIKIAKSVPGAVTLSPRTVRFSDNLRQIAQMLHKLHFSELEFPNQFDFISEWHKYEQIVNKEGADYYPDYENVRQQVFQLYHLLEHKYGLTSQPCHNDLVAENFVKSDQGRLFLIDWEYSGMNDPFWDLAALCNESQLTTNETQQFLSDYFTHRPSTAELTKLNIFKVFQDMLWSTWTIAKEASGENFGRYGRDRYDRGVKLMQEVLLNEAK
ncbi:hypothetical protein AYR56_09990 [Loigolactobacillus backii]|uniref:MobA-like NTP transferase domain-containing protein n=1 Tax=Loigolactobacillus backii TaxID=375175 RepID=A0A192H2T1_9LACO|nr:phosphotransferase [Loigolactobacillus backii]ANK62537.1 hypothetical protein AYR53_07010 [Loigolactobacillus backii]ANK70452.1 hypothetical protein AYR56_09990 [Loigolactobacillus backii]